LRYIDGKDQNFKNLKPPVKGDVGYSRTTDEVFSFNGVSWDLVQKKAKRTYGHNPINTERPKGKKD